MLRKILIVGPAWIGDMIMAQTLFKLLKSRDPQVQIDVIAPKWTAPLLSRMSEVHRTIELPFQHGELKLRERYSIGKFLRKENYHQAILLPNSFKSALIPWFARIPIRTGWQREARSMLLTDARHLSKKRYPLMIEQYMALGLASDEALPKPYPRPELMTSLALQQTICNKFNIAKTNKPILALCPGAEFGPAKRWPAAHYAAVANAMLQKGWDIWLFGSPKDTPITEEIMQLTKGRCLELAGKTTLTESIDLLSLVTGVITNDSGLMHVAAALNKPLIAIYGPTSTQFTPPLAKEAYVLQLQLNCQPCFKRVCPLLHHQCMQHILPLQVLAKTNEWPQSCVSY